MTDPIIASARFIAAHLEWMRHRPECDEFLTDVATAARVVARLARGPADRKYLGPCGAPVDVVVSDYAGPHTVETTCEGDVYVRGEGSVGRCRECGAEVARADREAWLDAEVRSRAFRASEIGSAYGINVNTIRTWAARGLLVQRGIDRELRPVYLVGDVLDLAAQAAARRAERESERARRGVAA